MARSLSSKVVAIPVAVSAAGSAIAKLVAEEHCDLVLGAATSAQFKSVASLLRNEGKAYPIQVDLECPKSVDEFFKIAIGQFGRIDAIVLETMTTGARTTLTEKSIGLGARRLLHCLDSALRYCDGDLHLINIAPVAGRYAIPIATAFLGAKLATGNKAKSPASSLRMSIVSPFCGDDADDGTLARTVVHVLREQRIPDVTESVFWRKPHQLERGSQLDSTCSKIMLPM